MASVNLDVIFSPVSSRYGNVIQCDSSRWTANTDGSGHQRATRARLFLTERKPIAARTSSGSEISDGTPTMALASTKTITAKTVNNTTIATTHGLRVRTRPVYARPLWHGC